MDEWDSIDSLSINTVGKYIDVEDEQRIYSGIQLTGINLQHEIIKDLMMMSSTWDRRIGPIDRFTLYHTNGSIELSLNATWRRHV